MASNEEIAFEIYKNIRDKQNKQIELGTIKEEDIVELSEYNFIEELHKIISFQTASIEGFKELPPNLQVEIINSTYSNIFDSIDKVNDVKELVSSDGIFIPSEIVKASINSAIAKNESNINKINIVEEVIAVGIMAELIQLESIEEKIDYFENLSEEEQQEVIYGLTENNFGKDVADRRKEVNRELEFFKNSESRKHMSEEEAQRVENKLRQKNPIEHIAKKLGIESFDGTDLKKEGDFLIIIDGIKRKFEGKEPSFEELVSYINENAMNIFNLDEIQKMAQILFNREEKNLDEFFTKIGLDTIRKDRLECENNFNKYKGIIIEMLNSAYPGFENEVDMNELIYVVRGVFEDGKIDYNMLISNFDLYFRKREIVHKFDFNAFDKTTDIITNKINLLSNALKEMDLPEYVNGTSGIDLLTEYGEAVEENIRINKDVLIELVQKGNQKQYVEEMDTNNITINSNKPITSEQEDIELEDFSINAFSGNSMLELGMFAGFSHMESGIFMGSQRKNPLEEQFQVTDTEVQQGIQQGTLQQEEMIVNTANIRTARGEQEETVTVDVVNVGQVEQDNKIINIEDLTGVIINGQTEVADSDLKEMVDVTKGLMHVENTRNTVTHQGNAVQEQQGNVVQEQEENNEDLTQ